MANIRDIAKIAGVSKTTVSRVINNHQYVSEEIREKVQAAIEKTGYVVNGNAVKLSNGKNYTLGVTLPYNNSCYDRLVNSLLFHAKEKGYQVLLLPTYYDEETESEYYSLLEKRMIDGLILVSRARNLNDWTKLKSRGRIVSTEKVADPKIPMIYPDRKKTYEQLFKQLVQQGVSKVVFTNKRSLSQSTSARDKVECYQKFLGEVIEGENFFTGIEGYDRGYFWAKKTYEEQPIPEVIYANADDTAAGIISGLQELGFSHGKDYQIIGEGNLPYSKLLNFSTIDFLPDEIGSKVIDYILSDQATVNIAMEPKFIKR
ncbi:LacI family DNA-binding transcriptional regulator [Candidatus Enterococcus murrayae]|uniref:LacI family DNA-binding transcriptional regulator n=1 Tax=Candidatus Enterococcus murrayae TaxID=2815321 RepID=A0ABS3HQR2_9ENTE|nr:LacI family DNA-binding transcriptional regulator [Enterococcus sp. MJM16]MBO0454923.1 LacI family DNA-binding transcriptional regulator [Enterococcus sp. MJM16]